MKHLFVALLLSLATQAFAASNDDSAKVQHSGCFVTINNASMTRLVNVDYIRLFFIKTETPNVLNISFASNFAMFDNLRGVEIIYKTPKEAVAALQEFASIIKSCR